MSDDYRSGIGITFREYMELENRYAMYSHPESFVARPRLAALTAASPRRGKNKSTALPAVSDSAPVTERVQ